MLMFCVYYNYHYHFVLVDFEKKSSQSMHFSHFMQSILLLFVLVIAFISGHI